MAAKRASFLDKLEKELPEPSKAAFASAPAAPEARAATSLTRSDIHKTTIYIPDAVHDRLREIAYTERRKVHDLLMEGIDRVMENRGHPERTAASKAS